MIHGPASADSILVQPQQASMASLDAQLRGLQRQFCTLPPVQRSDMTDVVQKAQQDLLRRRLAGLRAEQDVLRVQTEPGRAEGLVAQQRAALKAARLAIVNSEICSLLGQLRHT